MHAQLLLILVILFVGAFALLLATDNIPSEWKNVSVGYLFIFLLAVVAVWYLLTRPSLLKRIRPQPNSPTAPNTISLSSVPTVSGYDWELLWTASTQGSQPITYQWAIYADQNKTQTLASGSTTGTSADLSSANLQDWTYYYAQVTATNQFGSAPSDLVRLQTAGVPIVDTTSLGWNYRSDINALSVFGWANTPLTNVSSTVSINGSTPASSMACYVSENSGVMAAISDILVNNAAGYLIFSFGSCQSAATINSNLNSSTAMTNVGVYNYTTDNNGNPIIQVLATDGDPSNPLAIMSLTDFQTGTNNYSLSWAAQQGGCIYTASGVPPQIIDTTPIYQIVSGTYCPYCQTYTPCSTPGPDCSQASGTFICYFLPTVTIGSGTSFDFSITLTNKYGTAPPVPFNVSIAGTPPNAPTGLQFNL